VLKCGVQLHWTVPSSLHSNSWGIHLCFYQFVFSCNSWYFSDKFPIYIANSIIFLCAQPGWIYVVIIMLRNTLVRRFFKLSNILTIFFSSVNPSKYLFCHHCLISRVFCDCTCNLLLPHKYAIHKYENLKKKLYNCNANIYFNQQCLTAIHKYKNLKAKLYNCNANIYFNQHCLTAIHKYKNLKRKL